MNSLIHLIYCSAASRSIDALDMPALLRGIRENNRRLNVTGLLLYSEGSFFQVLEGPRMQVDQLTAKISNDSRHSHITIIYKEVIRKRSFASWSMGFTQASREELQGLSGEADFCSEFFSSGRSLSEVECDRVRKLLVAFGKGRWRNKISANLKQEAA